MADRVPSNDAGLSLRERKKLQTRLSLEDTALRLFLERGFAETTLDELVAEVGVSKRTFFRLYSSKEDVAMAAEMELWGAYVEAVAARDLAGPVLEFLRDALVAAIESRDDEWDRRFVTTRGLMARTPALWDRSLLVSIEAQGRLVDTLEGRLDASGSADLRIRLVGELAFGAWRCAARSWIAGRSTAGTGPHQRLGTWRGPSGRNGLVSSVRDAFDTVPASVHLDANSNLT